MKHVIDSSLQGNRHNGHQAHKKGPGIVRHQGKTDQKPHEGMQVQRLQPSYLVRLLEPRSLRRARTTWRPSLKNRNMSFSFNILKQWDDKCLGRCTQRWWECKIPVAFENVWQFLKWLNTFHRVTIWFNNCTPDIYLPKGKAYPDICAQIYMVALCLTVKSYKQPKYLSTDSLVN